MKGVSMNIDSSFGWCKSLLCDSSSQICTRRFQSRTFYANEPKITFSMRGIRFEMKIKLDKIIQCHEIKLLTFVNMKRKKSRGVGEQNAILLHLNVWQVVAQEKIHPHVNKADQTNKNQITQTTDMNSIRCRLSDSRLCMFDVIRYSRITHIDTQTVIQNRKRLTMRNVIEKLVEWQSTKLNKCLTKHVERVSQHRKTG